MRVTKARGVTAVLAAFTLATVGAMPAMASPADGFPPAVTGIMSQLPVSGGTVAAGSSYAVGVLETAGDTTADLVSPGGMVNRPMTVKVAGPYAAPVSLTRQIQGGNQALATWGPAFPSADQTVGDTAVAVPAPISANWTVGIAVDPAAPVGTVLTTTGTIGNGIALNPVTVTVVAAGSPACPPTPTPGCASVWPITPAHGGNFTSQVATITRLNPANPTGPGTVINRTVLGDGQVTLGGFPAWFTVPGSYLRSWLTAKGADLTGPDWFTGGTLPAGEYTATIQSWQRAYVLNDAGTVLAQGTAEFISNGPPPATALIVDPPAVPPTPTPTPTPAVDATPTATPAFAFDRLAGPDRYDTSVAVAEQFGTSTNVILANGDNNHFPDALTAAYLAGKKTAPVMLTNRDTTPPNVLTRIAASGATDVWLVGGEGVISAAQEAALEGLYTVHRLGGLDRYLTAQAVIEDAGVATTTTAILATGVNFPDAIAAGPLSYVKGMPLAITETNRLPAATLAALKTAGTTKVLVLGGPTVVSDDVLDTLAANGITLDQRIFGADRAQTSALLAEYLVTSQGFSNTGVNVASGYALGGGADALAGGALSGKENRPTLITNSDTTVGPGVLAFLKAHSATLTTGHIFGGLGAVTQAAEDDMVAAANGVAPATSTVKATISWLPTGSSAWVRVDPHTWLGVPAGGAEGVPTSFGEAQVYLQAWVDAHPDLQPGQYRVVTVSTRDGVETVNATATLEVAG